MVYVTFPLSRVGAKQDWVLVNPEYIESIEDGLIHMHSGHVYAVEASTSGIIARLEEASNAYRDAKAERQVQ